LQRRLTKIVATLGPASSERDTIAALIRAGMDVARLNFSHGEHEAHRRTAVWVREAAADAGRAVAILQDIQGPKIRVGTFPGGRTEFDAGDTVIVRPGTGEAAAGELQIDYPHLVEDLEPGLDILLVDGLVRLRVDERGAGSLRTSVLEGGIVGNRQGAAFPGAQLRVPSVTEKDRLDLELGKEIGVDFVAASFVRSADDVDEVRRLAEPGTPIIAKIELAAAYENLGEILGTAHGAMVARGDLGVEMELERLPGIQSAILSHANRRGAVSITATEMLESMTHAWRPTRAEVTDVSSAVLDGTDAVMLSGETAIGDHPVRVVELMDRICRTVEGEPRHQSRPTIDFLEQEAPVPSATTRAAVAAAHALKLSTIIAFTETGSTARLLSKYRPNARILAFTPKERTYRRMALYWGVEPRQFDRFDSTDEMLGMAERRLVEEGICEPGETVLMVAGIPPNRRSSTNFMKLHQVGSL
jgi:pyruvate kinase